MIADRAAAIDIYPWLAAQDAPRMIRVARTQIGVAERGGVADNQIILRWAAECGLARSYTADAVPWCGLFMAWVAASAGKAIPPLPLRALSWISFGNAAPAAGLGDVLVFRRNGGGHVGLYVAEDETAFHVLGGNQADRVSIVSIARHRLHAARRPTYRLMPKSVRAYRVRAAGETSRNEA